MQSQNFSPHTLKEKKKHKQISLWLTLEELHEQRPQEVNVDSNSNHKDCLTFTFTQPHLKLLVLEGKKKKNLGNLINIWFSGNKLKLCCGSQFQDTEGLPVDSAWSRKVECSRWLSQREKPPVEAGTHQAPSEGNCSLPSLSLCHHHRKSLYDFLPIFNEIIFKNQSSQWQPFISHFPLTVFTRIKSLFSV